MIGKWRKHRKLTGEERAAFGVRILGVERVRARLARLDLRNPRA